MMNPDIKQNENDESILNTIEEVLDGTDDSIEIPVSNKEEKLTAAEIERELEMGDDDDDGDDSEQFGFEIVEEKAEVTPSPDKVSEVLEWVKLIAIALFLGWILTTYVIQRNTVKGRSMEPTLQSGDELFVEKISLYFTAISRGDIITVDTHGLDPLEPNRVIKRVIGMPGETVRITGGMVYINDKELEEPYLETNGQSPRVTTQPDMELTLKDDEYFCLGDNRPFSKDSRVFGPVPRENILGKVLVRMYPFDKFGQP